MSRLSVTFALFFGALFAGPSLAQPSGEAGLIYKEAKKRFGDMKSYCALNTDERRQRLWPIIMDLVMARRIRDPMTAGTEAGAALRGECESNGTTIVPVDGETLRWMTTGLPALTFEAQEVSIDKVPPARRLGNRLLIPFGKENVPVVVVGPTMGSVSEHLYTLTSRLLSEGFAVLVLDPYSPRKIRPNTLIFPSEMVRDAYDALKFLQTQRPVDTSRIYFTGYSLGGMAATMLASPASAKAFHSPYRYKATVSNYGGCVLNGMPGSTPTPGQVSVPLLSADSDQPVLVLMAGEDIETPPEPCHAILEELKNEGKPAAWHLYQNTTHGWDKSENNGYVFRAADGRTMAYRYDPAITEDATQRAIAFFNAHP
jgi:dienelactone hydrolase